LSRPVFRAPGLDVGATIETVLPPPSRPRLLTALAILVAGLAACSSSQGSHPTTTAMSSFSVSLACQADAKAVEIAQEAFRISAKPTAYAPNIAALIPTYLRNAPSPIHYQIYTNGSGGVWVYGPTDALPTGDGDNAHNFDMGAPVCSASPAGFIG
jgi:hypothetical protein